MNKSGTLIALAGALIGSAAGGQNLLANPDFDQDGNSWEMLVGSAVVWQVSDEGTCPASGSIVVDSSPDSGFETAVLRQCVPAGSLSTVAASVSFREGGPWNSLFVFFHLSVDCTDPSPPFVGQSPLDPSPGAWARLEVVAAAVPAGTQSFEYRAGGGLGGDPFSIELDRAYLGTAERVFAADFDTDEAGGSQPCRWSTANP